jgi:uncharacterized protein YceK
MKYAWLVLIVIPALLSGCATANYTAPEHLTQQELSTTIDRNFDSVWTAIIDHVSASFFSIDSFEKNSGLIVVTFGADNIYDFVDCGDHEAEWTGEGYQRHSFNGPYAEFLYLYRDGRLTGRLNITARPTNDSQTIVRVNARYVLQTSFSTWSFDTNSSESIDVYRDNPNRTGIRTCQPTHLAESTILDAVERLSYN